MAFAVSSNSFKDGDYLGKAHILSADFGFGLTSSIKESDSGFFVTAGFSTGSEGLLTEVDETLAALSAGPGASFSPGRGLFSFALRVAVF